jgi:hypothetical protein
MSDTKTSQLPERVTGVLGTDLLAMVGNTAGTPANLRVQVKNFLSGFAIDLPATSVSAHKLTANVTANATAATLVGGEYVLQANSSVNVTVRDRIGLIVRNQILNGNSNVTGQMWGAHVQLDLGNSNVTAANTFGLVIDHTIANTSWNRLVSPRAFVALKEQAGASGNTTTYLLDVGAQGNTVSANLSSGNATVLFSKASTTTATHKLRCTINGTDYWLMLTSAF